MILEQPYLLILTIFSSIFSRVYFYSASTEAFYIQGVPKV